MTGAFAPRALGEENPVRTELREQLETAYERRYPEGLGPSRHNQRWLLAALGGVSLMAVVVMIYILGYIAGWVTAVFGALILALFFFIGASGYILGAADRAADAAHIKAEVVRDIEAIEHDRLTDTGAGPVTTF